ncbi:MAG: hypothetical protein WKG07_42985 [Hymenobacter sp.]
MHMKFSRVSGLAVVLVILAIILTVLAALGTVALPPCCPWPPAGWRWPRWRPCWHHAARSRSG